jgi:O-antigen ligase
MAVHVAAPVVAAPTLSRRPRTAVLAPLALLALAAVTGLVAGLQPAIGIGLALAFVFMLLATWDLALGVCGFVLLAPLDVISSNSEVSLTKAAGALLVLAWIAAVATQGKGKRKRSLVTDQPWLTAFLVGFIAWSMLSVVWAESTPDAYRATMRFALNAVLFPIVYLAVRDRRHVIWILGVFVLGAQLSVVWGFVFGPSGDSTVTALNAQAGRLTGARADSNVLATLLLVSTVFAAGLAVVLRSVPLARSLALGASLLGVVALFATFSRGGVVALVVVVLVGLVYGGRWRKGMALLGLTAVLVGAVYIVGAMGGGSGGDRLLDSSTSGRSSIWTVGWRMVTANPVLGVGSGNYIIAEPHYLLTSPGSIAADQFIIDTPYVAHNIYLHVLAEMGVIGLALFLGLIALSIASAMRAVRIAQSRDDRVVEALGRALVMALAGMLAADFFVSEQYSKQLWLLLALGPALLAIAQPEVRAHVGRPGAPRTPGARPSRRA